MTNELVVKSRHESPAIVLIRTLEICGPLSVDDHELVRRTCTRLREHTAGSSLDEQKRPYGHFIVSGWVGRLKVLSDGRRQVFTTAIPRELVGRHPNPLINANTIALTDVVTLDISPLLEVLEKTADYRDNLSSAMIFVQHSEEAQLANQILRLGRRTALERLGHWLLEIHKRLESVGLVEGDTFSMPLTQDMIADVLGLSVVHVNRTIQLLRRSGFIELSRGYVTLKQINRLRAITEFGDFDLVSNDWRTSSERTCVGHF